LRPRRCSGRGGTTRRRSSTSPQRAGVALGTFYTYFPNKQAAFADLVRDLSHRLRGALFEAAQQAPDRIAAERAGLEAFFGFIAEHRALYRIVRQAEFVDEELYRWYYRRIAEGYSRGIAAASERGEIVCADPDTVAWALMGMADFLGMRWVLWEGTAPPPDVVEAAVALLRDGLAPRGSGWADAGAPTQRASG
jgi:AcrR family transcriptional regulator